MNEKNMNTREENMEEEEFARDKFAMGGKIKRVAQQKLQQ